MKCFGAGAENHAKYLAKGRQVAINGRLSQSQWTDEAGNRRERLECIAQRIDYLSGGRTNGDHTPADIADGGEAI